MLSSIGLACAPPLAAARRLQHARSKYTYSSCAASSNRHVPERQPLPARVAAGAAAIAAAALVAGSPMPADADVPMVPSQDVTAAAKPLAKQEVQKGRVWLLLAGGSAVLFGSTVALERAKLFPAIAKANDAISVNRAARQAAPDYIDVEADRQQQPNDVGSWEEADYPSTDAVLAGLQSASSRVLTGEKDGGGQPADYTSAVAGSSTADSTADSPAAAEAGPDAAHSGAAAVAAGATAAAVEEPAAALADHSAEEGSAAAAAQIAAAEADDGSAPGNAADAKSTAESAQSPAEPPSGGTSDQADKDASASAAKESSSSPTTTTATDRRGEEPSTTAVDVHGRNGSPQAAPDATDSAAPPILSDLSSEEIERLIAAKLQQQQISAKTAKSQPALAGRNVEDLSEDELLSLIASKRRLAQIALSGVIDSDDRSK